MAIMALLGGLVWLLARKLNGGGRLAAAPPPTQLERERRLNSDLEAALSCGNGPMWDAVSEECRRIGRPDLPGHVLDKFPHCAGRLNRP